MPDLENHILDFQKNYKWGNLFEKKIIWEHIRNKNIFVLVNSSSIKGVKIINLSDELLLLEFKNRIL